MDDADDRLRAGALAAALSQAGPALREVAHLMVSYRNELLCAGLSQDEAFELIFELQREIMVGA